MISLKKMIVEGIDSNVTITPGTIYNFYFLWGAFTHQPELFQTQFGQHILSEYLQKFQTKYIILFKQLLSDQLKKYVSHKRVDPDFDVKRIEPTERADVLWKQMQKTFRSDMQRRNDVWNLVGEYLTGLEAAHSPKDIFVYVDRLNACVHNTQTLVLGKFNGGQDLMKAYATTNDHDPKYWKQYVDKDLKQLLDQGDAPMTEATDPKDRENFQFMGGVNMATQDKANDYTRDLSGYHGDFVRGYKTVRRPSWWSKTNDHLTRWSAEFGKSYGNRH